MISPFSRRPDPDRLIANYRAALDARYRRAEGEPHIALALELLDQPRRRLSRPWWREHPWLALGAVLTALLWAWLIWRAVTWMMGS